MFVLDATGRRGQFYSMKRTMRILAGLSTIALSLGLSTSCRTVRDPAPGADVADKQMMQRQAKPPQVLGITAYTSDEGARFAGIFRPQRDHVGRLPFISAKNSTAPVIAAPDGRGAMLLDTSAAESWISLREARRLETVAIAAPALFEKTARHVPDQAGGFAVILSWLRLEKLTVGNALFYVRNPPGTLDALIRGQRDPEPAAILGADFMRSLEFVRISLRGRRVIFSGTSVYPYAANAIARVPLVNLEGGLGVDCIIDGERQRALLDIAGDFEVALDRSSTSTLRQVSMGDIVFRQVGAVPTLASGFSTHSPPRLGRGLLERYDLVIHRRGTELLLEKPTK